MNCLPARVEFPAAITSLALGFVDRRVEGDLKRFKTFIETRREPTGAWTGEIHGTHIDRPAS